MAMKNPVAQLPAFDPESGHAFAVIETGARIVCREEWRAIAFFRCPAERVLEILDREGAIDLDKQQASWREEGWTGYPREGAAAASTAAGMASETDLAVSPGRASFHVRRRRLPELKGWRRLRRAASGRQARCQPWARADRHYFVEIPVSRSGA